MPSIIKHRSLWGERGNESVMIEVRDIRITVESHNFDYFARVMYSDGLVEDYVIQRDDLGRTMHASNVVRIANGTLQSDNFILDLRDWTLLGSSNFSNGRPQIDINEVNNSVVGRVSNININPSVASLETIRGASNNLRALNDSSRFNMEVNEDVARVLDNEILDAVTRRGNDEARDFISEMQARPNLTNHLINANLIEYNRRNTAEFINEVTREIKAGRNPLGNEPKKEVIKKYRAEFNELDSLDI